MRRIVAKAKAEVIKAMTDLGPSSRARVIFENAFGPSRPFFESALLRALPDQIQRAVKHERDELRREGRRLIAGACVAAWRSGADASHQRDVLPAIEAIGDRRTHPALESG